MSAGSISQLNLLKLEDVVAFLNVSEISVRRLISKRKLPYYKVGRSLRFEKQDVLNFLKQNRVESAELT